MVDMVSGDAFGSRVVNAHEKGELHVQGLEDKGGLWASWDCAAIAGKDADGNRSPDALERLVHFVSKARCEWSCFQRLSGFESLVKTTGDVNIAAFNAGIGEESAGRILLGLEEQNREEGDPVLVSILRGLRSPEAQTGDLMTVVVFTDAYAWGTKGDLPLFDSANALCSPIFMHRKEATTRKAVDPWLDGASPGVNTGVLGAVTLNLPRIAFTSDDEAEFFDRVWDLTGLAVEGLEAKRSHLDRDLKEGRMPATGSIISTFDDFFGAVGVVGMNEALLNLVERGIGSMQGKVIAYKILEAIKDRLEEKDKETGHRFCLIAEPSQIAAYRLAEMDRVKYPEIKSAGVNAPFYTGSTCLPVDHTDDLWDALEHQKKLHAIYNGGTIFNIITEKAISDAKGCKTLVRKIVEKTPLPCFAFSPSVDQVERYERMGYWYKPVSGMVAGEVEEVRLRKPFAVVSGW
jgi:hypothetical protein